MSLAYLSPAVRWVFLAVIVALVLASVAVAALSRKRPERDYRELWLRVRTWWLIVGLFALAVLLGSAWTLLALSSLLPIWVACALVGTFTALVWFAWATK